MSGKPRGASTPRQRLGKDAEATVSGKANDVAVNGAARDVVIERPTTMKVRTKFLVVDKSEVPAVVGHDLITRFHVKLQAAYEARPIFHGLATEQGNGDNKIFGLGQPEAVIGMVIESKAIADTFITGRAFAVEFIEIVD